MNILSKAIVSNSDMIKKYKACREKAEILGKIFILKNNRPDAVLVSITQYQELSPLIEYAESLEEKDMAKFIGSLPRIGISRSYSIVNFKNDIAQSNGMEIIL